MNEQEIRNSQIEDDDPLGLNETTAWSLVSFENFSPVEFDREQNRRHLINQTVIIEGDDDTSGYTIRVYPRTRMEMLKLWGKVL